MILIDTDVLIWNMRGNAKAAEQLKQLTQFSISSVTWMELTQGVHNNDELRLLKQAMRFWQAEIIHTNESISARACYLVESYALGHSLQLADALIAATALETGLSLLTANDKHYRYIPDLLIQIFRP